MFAMTSVLVSRLAGLILACCLAATFGMQLASAAGSNSPESVSSQLWSGDSTVKTPLKYDSRVSPTSNETGCGASSQAFVGDVGWRLGCIDQFQFPETSLNNGHTWKIGGLYFSYSGGKDSSHLSVIKPFSQTIVAAYRPGSDLLFVTSDDGLHWLRTSMPGKITSVNDSLSKSKMDSGFYQMQIRVKISAGGKSRSQIEYVSSNTGRSWILKANAS
jgi:hypothetical protein